MRAPFLYNNQTHFLAAYCTIYLQTSYKVFLGLFVQRGFWVATFVRSLLGEGTGAIGVQFN